MMYLVEQKGLAMTSYTEPRFNNDEAAREYLERVMWPEGTICPHCGVVGHSYATKRAGVYRCAEPACRKDFTVTMRTVMERSKIALHKWVLAFALYTASKKGFSAHQLHRTLGVTYRSAWFMAHRIRESMRDGGLEPMGGEGQIVEADETYFGKAEKPRVGSQRRGAPYLKNRKVKNDRPIVSLVERSGNVRSFHVAVADASTVAGIVLANIKKESRLQTDESKLYKKVGAQFTAHETVNHGAKEYARGDVTTNTVEGYFSIFKRGMKGVYQHCKEKHLHRYLAEYDFRFNHRVVLGYNDGDRATLAVKNAAGKRLTYRGSH
ncbi:transposase-like protein [Bradyrhizobium sp. USDA 3256]